MQGLAHVEARFYTKPNYEKNRDIGSARTH